MGRQSWRARTLATFKRVEQVSKYIEDNDNRFLIIGVKKYKYGKGKAKMSPVVLD